MPRRCRSSPHKLNIHIQLSIAYSYHYAIIPCLFSSYRVLDRIEAAIPNAILAGVSCMANTCSLSVHHHAMNKFKHAYISHPIHLRRQTSATIRWRVPNVQCQMDQCKISSVTRHRCHDQPGFCPARSRKLRDHIKLSGRFQFSF